MVAFAISFGGALGGYFTAGGTAATLAFVLAIMSPGIDSDLASRELGWVVGVVIAAVAAVVLWPVHQRDRVRGAAAAVLRETASALTVPAARRDLAALRARRRRDDRSHRSGVPPGGEHHQRARAGRARHRRPGDWSR